MKPVLIQVLSASALLTTMCSAATLVSYTAANSGTNPTITASTVATGISADVLSAGSGLTAFSATGKWVWRQWDTASTSSAAALAANDFWSWGFDVATGYAADLTSLAIAYDRHGSGPDDVNIVFSVNGGSSTSIHTYDFGDSTDINVVNIDLTGYSALQDLDPGDSVVFTLTAFNSESTSVGQFILDNDAGIPGGAALVVSGDIAVVPEPSSAILGALGLLGLLRRRR